MQRRLFLYISEPVSFLRKDSSSFLTALLPAVFLQSLTDCRNHDISLHSHTRRKCFLSSRQTLEDGTRIDISFFKHPEIKAGKSRLLYTEHHIFDAIFEREFDAGLARLAYLNDGFPS